MKKHKYIIQYTYVCIYIYTHKICIVIHYAIALYLGIVKLREMRNGAGKVLLLCVKYNNTDTVRNNILTLTPVNTTYIQISCTHMPM